MTLQEDKEIIEARGSSDTLFVKHLSNPVLDSVRTKTNDLRTRLLAAIGESADDVLEQLIKHPSDDVALLNEQENAQSLYALADDVRNSKRIRAEREKACASSMSDPMARFAITHILPALVSIAADKQPLRALRAFASSLPFKETLNAWRIRLATWGNPDFLSGLSPKSDLTMKITNCMSFLNNELLNDTDYTLRIVDGKSIVDGERKDVETCGLLKIHDWDSFDVPDVTDESALVYMYVSRVFPTVLTNGNLGHWDNDLREAVIFRDVARDCAQRLMEIAAHPRRSSPEHVALSTYIAQRYDLDAAQSLFECSALCEEVKHGINDMRRQQTAGRRDFTERRLASGLLRHINKPLLDMALPEKNFFKEFLQIEECNVKLMKLIVGPDPAFEVLMTQCHFRSAAGNDYEHLAQLLCRYTREESNDPAAMRDHLRNLATALPENELRMLGMHILQKEFNESIESTPFCTIDDTGKLVRHAGTRDAFAAWAR